MEKKTRTIVSDYWELNPADMFVFKELLNYGYHRLTKHNDT